MPWQLKNPDLKNNPLYLEPRVNELDAQMAQKATKEEFKNKAESIFSIVEYEAKGDYNGTTGTDNYNALLQTLNAISANGGGVLLIPYGDFFIGTDTPLEIPSNVRTICVGRIIYPSTRTKVLFNVVDKENIELSYLNIDGSFIDPTQAYSDSCHAIMIKSSKNISVRNCNIEHLSGDGIYVGRDYTIMDIIPSENIVIEHNSLNNTKRNAIAVVCGRTVTVKHNNIISDNGNWNISAVIDVEPNNSNDELTNIIIEYNTVSAVSTEVIRSLVGSGKSPTKFENIRVRFNEITCITNSDGVKTSRAIAFTGGSTGKRFDISDNQIKGEVTTGIQAYSVVSDLRVEGNFVENAEINALLITYNDGDVFVNRNKVKVTSPTGRAVYLNGNDGYTYHISDNTVDNGGSTNEAVFVNGNNNIFNVHAHRNKITNGAKSLRFFQVNTLRYRDNECSGSITDTSNTNVSQSSNTANGTFVA